MPAQGTAMTDPTTRYPLPDDPGNDPLAAATAAPPPSSAPPPADAAPSAPPPGPPSTDWQPPRQDENRVPAIIFGIILITVGLWFFAETTLGLDLPSIRWSQLWPVLLIGVGVLILWGARVRRRP
jgi:hypothetical protein